MRQRKLDLRGRVNGNLALEFDDGVALTSYAGLELFARYLRQIQPVRATRRNRNGCETGIIQGSLSERAHGVIQVAEVVPLNGLGQIWSLDRISRTERDPAEADD